MPDVIIVGAGISGIMCARFLQEHQQDFIVLEASARIGGRIYADNNTVELGAEEIDGERSAAFELARALNMQMVEKGDKIIWYDDAGGMQANFEKSPAYELIDSIFDLPAGNEISILDQVHAMSAIKEDRFIANALLSSEYGNDIAGISCTGLQKERELWQYGSGTYLPKGLSLSGMVAELCNPVKAHIQFSTEITRIDHSESIIRVYDRNDNVYHCKKVIVTVPVSILKAGDIEFVPKLPAEKKLALNDIGMCSGIKIIAEFAEKFWTDDLDLMIVQDDIDNFSALPNAPVLTSLLSGQKADSLKHKNHEEIFKLYHETLAPKTGINIKPLIKNFWVVDWGAMQFIHGLYSFPLSKNTLESRKILAKPIDNKIFFAGEAVDFSGQAGTVSGAIQSAYNVARQIKH